MRYSNLVPEDSFIGQYMEYMSYVETAEVYDFWCAVWAIGEKCGRDVFVDRPRAPVYLNWYIILAAQSGTTRKSTAVGAISELVRTDDNYIRVHSKAIPERLVHNLASQSNSEGHARCTIAVPELVTLLGKEGYLVNMPGLLTALYDCPALTDGDEIDGIKRPLRNVYVTLLSASTPSWLITAITPAVIEGGFTSRVIFVCSERRKRAIAWPSDDAIGMDGTKDLLVQAVEGACDVGKITLNKNAFEHYTKWYRTRHAHKDTYRSSFEAREDDHVLRLAACLSINDGSYRINQRHISTACKVISDVKQGAFELFGGDGGATLNSRLAEGIDKTRRELVKAGLDGVAHNKLYKAVRHKIDSKEFNLLMKIMQEAGMVQLFEIKGTRGKIYRATTALEAVGVTSTILKHISPTGSS